MIKVPTLRTVAMLWNVNDLGMTLRYQAAADAARTIGARVQPLGVREPNDFDEAFASMLRDPPDAILMVSDALTRLNRRRVYEFAAEHRLPTTYERGNYVCEFGLPPADRMLTLAAIQIIALGYRHISQSPRHFKGVPLGPGGLSQYISMAWR